MLQRSPSRWSGSVFAVLLLAALFAATPAAASTPVAGQAVGFAVSPPLSSLPPDEPVKPDEGTGDVVKSRPIKLFRFDTGAPDPDATDPVIQAEAPPETITPGPSLSFDGLTNQDNFNLFAFRVSPPDTDGDVGPNHYVQIVNLMYRIFDKTGAPLTPARRVSTIFSALPGPCATTDDGDPIVLYDPLADRWLISQFCVSVANPNNHQLIAISQTPDPTGAYFLYDFMMPNIKFNDYPHFGVWPDGYYMTDNQFNQAGTAFQGGGNFAFDRAKMLAGDPTAGFIYFDTCPTNVGCDIGGMLPADLDGFTPPPAGTPNYFAYFTADEFGDPFDGVRIFEFKPNFATPVLSTFVERAESPVAVAAFDPRNPSGRADIEQPAPALSTHNLDSIQDRLLFRLAYRNFGTHESLVVTHTVNVSGVAPTTPATHRAGVRYYELRRAGGSFSVNEQATFAPDTHNRWMGTAAMDGNGNLAVGYSVSSTTVFPSVRYAARLAGDPPNGLFQGEATMVAGTGVQRSTGSRWGDYSALSVDPADDCTFWYTQEYYTAASQASSTVGWLTRIGSFVLPSCTPAATGTLQGTVIDAVTLAPISGATVATTDGYVRITGAPGTYSMTVAAATYNMVASAPGYGSATALGVTVSTGGTTTQNFALAPMPILQAGGAGTVAAESCGPSNGAIDPGESVTVSLPVQNVGTANTVNLVGTLLAGGGVTSPGAAQNYGVVVAAGPSVARSFTFTAAGSCGGTITASLQLQDGVNNLGTVTYTFTLGALNPFPSTANYSSGNLSVPIPDVSFVEVPFVVPDAGAVTDVNVRVRLNHTFDGDLVIDLVGPDGTVVTLANKRGGSGDDYGSGATDCSGTPTVFDDAAVTPIASGVAPFAGTFKPDQPLSAFNGKPSAGTWKLRVSDTAALDVGTIYCFQLEIAKQVYACCGVAGTPVPFANGSALVAESCHPANGALDPDETVSVDFAIANAGSGATGNLVATLQTTGGVQMPGAAQSYGAIQPGGSVSRTFSFVPAGICGGSVVATLQLQDGATNLGTLAYTKQLGTTVGGTAGPFANPASITIPSSGAATPYPSTIAVSGVTGTVTKVTARLVNMNHTWPDDIDILLIGPGGQKLLLMSDTGGSLDLINVTLTFDDAGPALPDSTQIVSGTYRPTNYGTGDTFPVPAPAGPYGATLSIFNGINPNGTWSLYVVDAFAGDLGNIAGGWSLSFETADPVCCTEACSLACPAPITTGNDAGLCDAQVDFPFPAVTGTCGTVACAPPSGSIFPVGTTIDLCTAQVGSTCTFPITVQDVQPPVITGAAASPNSLWPPNHKMVNVAVNYTTADNCTAPVTCALSVTSNEPINGLGDGDTAPDWVVVNANLVQLRSERSGTGTGRIYTVKITCTDGAGVSSSQNVLVTVPHNQ